MHCKAEDRCRIAIPVIEQGVFNYTKVLSALGADPVVVDEMQPADDFDGLLLPGGTDIDPMLYGQYNTDSIALNRNMDSLQMRMLDLFVQEQKPVLGVCRGLQLVNIYFGGSLLQNIATARDHWGLTETEDQVHLSHAVKGSWLEKIYGEKFSVNSYHHQAIDLVGDGLEVIQFAEDGVIEGICHTAMPVYAVQWHPERISLEMKKAGVADGTPIFRFFLNKIIERNSRSGQKKCIGML